MVETVKFRGKAQVVGIDGVGFRMELVSEDNSIPWSGDDVGQSFDVTIKRVAPDPDAIIERVMCTLADRGIVPKPKPPSWDDAPEWAQWRAQSKRGPWYWWELEPRDRNDGWAVTAGAYTHIRGGSPNPNWRNTLQERPKPELKPCPFCGSEGRLETWEPPTRWQARCSGCIARLVGYHSQAEAVAAWNRRA